MVNVNMLRRTRTEARAHLGDTLRVERLEEDVDELDRKVDGLNAKLDGISGKINQVLFMILAAIITQVVVKLFERI